MSSTRLIRRERPLAHLQRVSCLFRPWGFPVRLFVGVGAGGLAVTGILIVARTSRRDQESQKPEGPTRRVWRQEPRPTGATIHANEARIAVNAGGTVVVARRGAGPYRRGDADVRDRVDACFRAGVGPTIYAFAATLAAVVGGVASGPDWRRDCRAHPSAGAVAGARGCRDRDGDG